MLRYNTIRHHRNVSFIQLVHKFTSLVLVWAIAFASLPVYGSGNTTPAASETQQRQLTEGITQGLSSQIASAPGVLNHLLYGGAVHEVMGFAPPVTKPAKLAAKAAFPGTMHATALLQAVTNAAVVPILECVLNNGGGSYTARFGYNNLNTVTINIPVGDNNKFNPNSSQRGQTTAFLPGRQFFAFDVPFDGSNLTWSLKGPDAILRNVAASSASPSCTANHPPVANAGPAQTVFVTTNVQLDGSGSTDADGDPLAYRWSLVSVPAGSTAALTGPTTVHPTFVVDKPGSYIAQLLVNDGKVDSTPATVTISTKNSQPVANAGPNQTITTGSTVQLNGSASSDVDGNPLTYSWSLASVPVGSAAVLSNPTLVNPAFITDKKGTYIVQLIVNDGIVNSAPSQVTISDVNSPPVANPGRAQTVATRTLVKLDGSASTDVDGDSLTYTWAILTAPLGSTSVLSDVHAIKPSFTVDVLGNYVIQLIVNDGTADSAPATLSISDVNSRLWQMLVRDSLLRWVAL
jgi:hypothetical protein